MVFRNHTKKFHRISENVGFQMRAILNYFPTTLSPTVSWSVPGTRQKKFVAVDPGLCPRQTLQKLALCLEMSALTRQ